MPEWLQMLIAGLIGIGAGVALIFVMAFARVAFRRFWKRTPEGAPQYAQLEARPGGVVLDLVDKDGTHVLASLVLIRIDWHKGGPTTAEFIDKAYWLERNRL